VAIVGVLAVVAYAGYHKFVVSSHQTEANHILSGIKNRQEAYKAETGNYLNVSSALAFGSPAATGFSALYPHCMSSLTAPTDRSVAWPNGPSLSACLVTTGTPAPGDWVKLKVESSAPTFYGYTTVAGCPTCTVPSPSGYGMKIGGSNPTWPTTIVGPWFVATAVGDTDGNGIYSTVMIESFDNTVYVDNDGE
jgi:Tfp pilus assembly protein PilE